MKLSIVLVLNKDDIAKTLKNYNLYKGLFSILNKNL